MKQVPHYLIIGDGRVSRHFQCYFSLLNLSYSVWHRRQAIEILYQNINRATHILILIKDDAINAFCETYLHNIQAYLIHFSGSLVSPYAYGAHPLMTFGAEIYTLNEYITIPFVLDDDTPDFTTLLPHLPNQNMKLNKSLKAKYHALCVLGGNFSCLLWQKLFACFEEELNIPASFAHPYLRQQTKNLLTQAKTALTGPLIRRDYITLQNNIAALDNDPFKEVYLSFVECYEKINCEAKK